MYICKLCNACRTIVRLLTHSNPLGFNVQAISFTPCWQLLICTSLFIPRLFSLLGRLVSFFAVKLQTRSPFFLKITLNLSSVIFSLSSSTARVTFLHKFLRMSIYIEQYKIHWLIYVAIYDLTVNCTSLSLSLFLPFLFLPLS